MKLSKSITLIITTLSLIACGNKDKALTLLVPTGAPAVAFYNFNNESEYKVETNANANQIVASMSGTNPYNAVVLPTNAGIQAIKAGAPYKLAATLTFGNFFVGSTGNDENSIMDAGDKVVIFQQNQIPDKIFKDIYGDIYNLLDIKYVANASEAAGVLKTGTYIDESGTKTADYVLVADPALRNALAGNKNASIYSNLRELYKTKHNNQDIMQASIFVQNSLETTTVNSLLNNLSNDINNGISNPALVKEGMDKKGNAQEVSSFYGVGSSLVLASISSNNGLGLGYKNAYENKASIDSFLSIIAPQIGVTDEEIYFK